MKGREADEHFMGLALEEARHGLGRTHPNPVVGAVIVKNGRLLSRGFHAKAGAGHAEAVALAAIGAKAQGATLYSTLEPCNHFGRTPPCAQAIIDAGLVRVVYASSDPNPLVNGKGHKALTKAGVQVDAHVLRAEADVLNRPFFKAIRTGLPWVTLKAAITLDGKIATSTGDSKWISSEASRSLVHKVRNVVDAIVVGASTVAADDPRLTTRIPQGHDAVRVVIDPTLRTSPKAKVFRPGSILVTLRTDGAEKFSARGAQVWVMPATRGGRISMKAVCRRLVKAGFHNVLVEGGAGLYAAMLDEGLVDELMLVMAPVVFGHSAKTWSGPLETSNASRALQFELLSAEAVGRDLLILARPATAPQGSSVPRKMRLATVK